LAIDVSAAGLELSTGPWDSVDACPKGQVLSVNSVMKAWLLSHSNRIGERHNPCYFHGLNVMKFDYGDRTASFLAVCDQTAAPAFSSLGSIPASKETDKGRAQKIADPYAEAARLGRMGLFAVFFPAEVWRLDRIANRRHQHEFVDRLPQKLNGTRLQRLALLIGRRMGAKENNRNWF
jgi:hypothetical protein